MTVRSMSTTGRKRTSDALATLIVCAAIFSDTFIYDLIIPFIPQLLQHRLHLPSDQVQLWTSTLLGVFGVAFAVGNVLAGFLTDYCCSKNSPFLLGIITMFATSLMFFLGEHVAVVVTARVLQGVSASLVWVSGLALLNTHVKASYIGKAMSWVSAASAIGEVLGPVVGGTMYEHAGHFAVMGLVCAILGVDCLLRMLFVDGPSVECEQTTAYTADEEEAPLLDRESYSETGSTDTAVEVMKHIASKKLDILGLSLDKDLCATFYAVGIVGTVRYGLESALVVFIVTNFSWSTSASGGVMFAFLASAAFGPIVGHFVVKHGPREISIFLFSALAVSLVCVGLLTQPDAHTKVLFVVAVSFAGAFLASLSTIQTIAFSVATKRRDMAQKLKEEKARTGVSFGGFSMAWSIGMFTGPLAAEVFFDHINWLAFCVFLAVLCVVSAVVMIFSWEEWEILDDE